MSSSNEDSVGFTAQDTGTYDTSDVTRRPFKASGLGSKGSDAVPRDSGISTGSQYRSSTEKASDEAEKIRQEYQQRKSLEEPNSTAGGKTVESDGALAASATIGSKLYNEQGHLHGTTSSSGIGTSQYGDTLSAGYGDSSMGGNNTSTDLRSTEDASLGSTVGKYTDTGTITAMKTTTTGDPDGLDSSRITGPGYTGSSFPNSGITRGGYADDVEPSKASSLPDGEMHPTGARTSAGARIASAGLGQGGGYDAPHSSFNSSSSP